MANKIIPSHIQIEIINGVCTARCTMCTFESWTRKKNTMSVDMFRSILERLTPYKQSFKFLTIHGCGEPLLDPTIAQKIKIAKDMDYKGTGFATNCTQLSEKLSKEILASGLDTIICSIDGATKATHESIRVGTSFENVVNNVERFIELRNSLGSKTRTLIRFIRQKTNENEWDEFKEYWENKIDKKKNDDVIKFDVHNWGDSMDDYVESDINNELAIEKLTCVDLYERLLIYSNGDVGFCCADDNGFFELGNVLEADPIEIYNNEIFRRYRKMMEEGRISQLQHCSKCTIPRSRSLKDG